MEFKLSDHVQMTVMQHMLKGRRQSEITSSQNKEIRFGKAKI